MTSYILKSTANNSYEWVIVCRSHKLNIEMTHRMSHWKSEGLNISMTWRMSHNESYLNIEAMRQKGRHREVRGRWSEWERVMTESDGSEAKGKRKRKKMRGVHNNAIPSQETIHHFIFECPVYNIAWNTLKDKISQEWFNLSNIMSNVDHIKNLIIYINKTKWLKANPHHEPHEEIRLIASIFQALWYDSSQIFLCWTLKVADWQGAQPWVTDSSISIDREKYVILVWAKD